MTLRDRVHGELSHTAVAGVQLINQIDDVIRLQRLRRTANHNVLVGSGCAQRGCIVISQNGRSIGHPGRLRRTIAVPDRSGQSLSHAFGNVVGKPFSHVELDVLNRPLRNLRISIKLAPSRFLAAQVRRPGSRASARLRYPARGSAMNRNEFLIVAGPNADIFNVGNDFGLLQQQSVNRGSDLLRQSKPASGVGCQSYVFLGQGSQFGVHILVLEPFAQSLEERIRVFLAGNLFRGSTGTLGKSLKHLNARALLFQLCFRSLLGSNRVIQALIHLDEFLLKFAGATVKTLGKGFKPLIVRLLVFGNRAADLVNGFKDGISHHLFLIKKAPKGLVCFVCLGTVR